MNFTLRDYQRRACRKATDAFEKGVGGERFRKLLLIAATGAGKTIMAAALIWYRKTRRKERSLFLADSDELCDQAVSKLWTGGGIIADLEKAESRASLKSDVVVASIQTLSLPSRLARFPADHFRLVVPDEAHLSMADSWQRVLKRFYGGGADILGITATPDRSDKISLMTFYEHIVDSIPMRLLMDQRHLTPFLVNMLPLHIKSTAELGDGDNEALGKELEAYYEAMVDQILVEAHDRKTILGFFPSVAASKAFTDVLTRRGEAAVHIDGTTKNRPQILEGFHERQFRYLNCAQLLIKGYDEDRIDAIVMGRPTRSRSSYTQQAGRGTRLYCPHGCPGWCDHPDRKMDCMVLDFLWQFPGLDVMGPWDLMTETPEHAAELKKKLWDCGKADLLDADRIVSMEREERLLKALREASKRGKLKLDARALGAALHQPELMDWTPQAKWQLSRMTDKQAQVLTKRGVDLATVQNKGHASAIISAFFERQDAKLATVRQVLTLRDNGVADAHTYGFDQAREKLDSLFSR